MTASHLRLLDTTTWFPLREVQGSRSVLGDSGLLAKIGSHIASGQKPDSPVPGELMKSGGIELFSTEGLFISVAHGEFAATHIIDYETHEDLYMMRAGLSAACIYEAAGSGMWEFRQPGIVVIHIPKGVRLRITVLGGYRQDGVNLLLRPSFFTDQFGIHPETMPSVLRPSADGACQRGTLATLPMTQEIATSLRDILQSRLSGDLRRVQVEARALELTALILAAIHEQPALAGPRAARQRHVDIANQARDLLNKHYADPPTVDAMARQLGTSKSKLNRLFQTAFGMTPQTFCVQRKMEQAQLLLLEGKLNICQVADAVGYQHQSSFTSAFREYAGMSPREYAKHRAALNFSLSPQLTAAAAASPSRD